jgi:hypothetical protein
MNLVHLITAWLDRKSAARARRRERRRLHLELIEMGRNRAQDRDSQKQQVARVTEIMNRLFELSLHADRESAESRLSGSELPWPGLPTEGLRIVRGGQQ